MSVIDQMPVPGPSAGPSTISGATRVLAILGSPVTHSLSPHMHAGWIADHGIDATYVALSLAHDGVRETMRALAQVGFHGANVTVPFKAAAAQAADVRSGDVETLGVANTLQWKDGKLHAHNTDWQGARRALDDAFPDWVRDVQHAVVIGGGGAARAIAYGIAHAGGPRVTIVNRALEKAQAIADLVGGGARAWADLPAVMRDADLIVNATSLGMTGAAPFDWPLGAAKPGAIVYDAVYAPLETDLLKGARARGLRTVDGLGMLIHQGALAFEIWFGVRPDTARARARLLAILAARS